MHGSKSPCNHLPEAPSAEASNNILGDTKFSKEANSNYYSFANELSPAAARATEAIEFVAEHLKCEDEYVQIREDWKYVAMTMDRLQLFLFTLSTTLDTPDLFQTVDQG